MSEPADSIVILQALADRPGEPAPVLTKRWRLGESGAPVALPVERAAWFAVHERPVSGLCSLEALLRKVERVPSAAVVRGTPLATADRRRTRRLSSPVDGRAATFGPAARSWLMLDIDGLADPPCDDMQSDPLACVEHALAQLPDELAEASCWWQASGSAGFKPGVRLHLWFWLDRALSDGQAAGWLQAAPVDLRLFHPVQLHYIAAPLLIGLRDPLPTRCGFRQGLHDAVPVPAELPERPVLAPLTARQEAGGDVDLEALQRAAARSRLLQELWRGERQYDDRSRAHFAVVVDLMRCGLDDLATIRAVLVAVDRRVGWDPAKSLRPDYAPRTLARARAALTEARP